MYLRNVFKKCIFKKMTEISIFLNVSTLDSHVTRVPTTRIPITRQRYCNFCFRIKRFIIQRAI